MTRTSSRSGHAPDHLAHRLAHDGPDGLLLVEGGQDQRDRDALLLLELDQPAQVAELAVVEVRFAEPALDPGRDGPGFLGGTVGGGKRLGSRGQRVEGRAPDGLAGLDHDHTRLGPGRDGLGQRPEQVRIGGVGTGHGGRAHDHEIGLLGLAQDGVADVGGLAQDRLALAPQVLLDERGQGPLGLGSDGHGDARRHEVQDHDRAAVMGRDGVGEAQGELGMGAAADRHEDALDVARAALLDHGDVGRGLAHDLVDGRREDRRAARPAVGPERRLAAPAEDDEVRLLLGAGLHDALGGVPADAHDGVDGRARRSVVEDLLEQPAGMPGAGRALGQGHPLGHFHDAQRGQFAGPRVEHRGTQPDELLGRARVGDRDEDAPGQRRLGAHEADSRSRATAASASRQRSTRYGLSSSNSRAWRSTRSSAWSVGMLRFSMTNEPTRPK